MCTLFFMLELDIKCAIAIFTYILINILYSKKIKNVVILDVLFLSSMYLLRIFYGALLVNVAISHWLYLTVLFGALFLSLGKRLGEIKSSQNTRKVLQYYNADFLKTNMYMSLTIATVFYSFWAVSDEIATSYPYMIWTTILFFAICMKYNLILEGESDGDPINVILKDKVLLGLIFIYCVVVIFIMYII